MAGIEDVGKALFGDEDSEVVKSGALAVTRLTGWVAAAGVALTNFEVFGELSTSQKLWGSIAIVAVFAFIAAADALARGYVTAHTQPQIRALTPPIRLEFPARPRGQETGWKAHMLRFSSQNPDDFEFWIVRDDEALWAKSSEVKPT